MWSSLQNLLPKAAAKYQFNRTLDAIEVCRQFRSLAPRFLPGECLKSVKTRSYKDRTLTLAVGNSAWAQQLHMRGHLIRDELNHLCGPNTVSRIRIVVADGQKEEDGSGITGRQDTEITS